jgi:hypothetical protein
MRLIFSTFLAASLLAGCAGHWRLSYDRWQKLQNSTGPRADWANCIDKRAWEYLSRENPTARPSWYKGSSTSDQVVFTWVLADCADKMSGTAWDHLQAKEYERFIGDAYQHFFTVGAEIQANEDAKTI